MPLTAGRRDYRISLLRQIQHDDHGDVKGDWADEGEVWASFKTIRSSERPVDGNNLATADVEFEILYSTEVSWISAGDAIRSEGVFYDVTGVEPIDHRRGLRLIAKTRDSING